MNFCEFADSYVDDISVFQTNGDHIWVILQVIKDSGFGLNLEKTCLAQGQVRFLGHIIGSRQYKVDPDKVKVVQEIKKAREQKQICQVLGFFSYFRDYIPNFFCYC